MSVGETTVDLHDVRRALHAPGVLRPFNDAGVLAAADVHVATRLTEVCGAADDELVVLGVAFAVRAPRLGHVCVDLRTIHARATTGEEEGEIDLSGLPWPDPDVWLAALRASPLVADGEDADASDRPLRLLAPIASAPSAAPSSASPPSAAAASPPALLYLDRYWREEREVARDLAALGASGHADPDELLARGPSAPGGTLDLDRLADGLQRLFPGQTDSRQTLAAASAVLRRFAVIAGGPGTGKTWTVARVLALLMEQAAAAGAPPPLVALAAPTGKAAARLEEVVHEEARELDVDEATRTHLLSLNASTLHRLLGWRPDSHSRFRHARGNRLPHDVVIVDETSMVSLSLMARLVEAVRPEARLVLVGDPGQLTSIEAGAVLGDIVGPATEQLLLTAPARAVLGAATSSLVLAADPPPDARVADGIVVLDRVHRYGGAIARVAEAVRRGDADGAVEALRAPSREIVWIEADAGDPDVAASAALQPVREAAVASARAVTRHARAGRSEKALAALTAFRLLCAHREGPHGVGAWMARVEGWLAEEVDGFGVGGAWYAGRPLLVTENDYGLRLYNGDTGVVVAGAGGRVTAAFERRGQVVTFRPARLGPVDTVYAMTVHKSQGSQFDTAAVVLPDASSQLLTRELLYTAVTRVQRQLILVGTEDTVRAAVDRPVARASGLRTRLWGRVQAEGGSDV